MIKSFALIAAAAASLAAPAWAAAPSETAADKVETLAVGTPLTRFSMLVPSTRLYLRYNVIGEARETLDIWRRQISYENYQGKRAMHIFWRWDSVTEPKFNRTEDFWFEPETFRPLTVVRHLSKDGQQTVGGYRYLTDRIVGMKELPDNPRKDFVQLAKMAPFNFETDMELLEALPLKSGYAVRIPFYEAGPGQEEPKYYDYRVVGEDHISAADGHTIDCWVVEAPTTNPDWGTTHFWLAKQGQVMLREETKTKDGTVWVKLLLTPDVAMT